MIKFEFKFQTKNQANGKKLLEKLFTKRRGEQLPEKSGWLWIFNSLEQHFYKNDLEDKLTAPAGRLYRHN